MKLLRAPLHRRFWLAALVLASVGLAGCETLQKMPVQVSSQSRWPADLPKEGTYRFDRLPSTEINANARAQQLALEDAARDALAELGLTESADEAGAPWLIQLSATLVSLDPLPPRDPFWGPRGWGGVYGGPGHVHGGLTLNLSPPRLEREVRLVLRQRSHAQVLWDGSASTVYYGSGAVMSIDRALYRALLQEFPQGTGKPTVVRIER